MSRRSRTVLPPGEHLAEITDLNHEGVGVAHLDGKTIFINGALPGEKIKFRYRARHKKFDEGSATEILEASTERVTPKCRHFGTCGGCSLQHLAPEAQIRHKEQTLLELLAHMGKVNAAEVLPPLTAAPWAYRHKARLGVRYVIKKASLFVGFREQHSNYLAELERCEILHPTVGELIMPLRKLIAGLSVYQDIAQIEVAIGDQETALVFRHLKPLSSSDEAALIAFAQEHQLWIYLQPGKPESIYKLYPADEQFFLTYSLPDYNLAYQFHPLDFTQINPELNRSMVKLALDLLELTEKDTALDLFCGLGNFTLPIAKTAASVVGVEGSATMVERAQMNAINNNIHNVTFYAANLIEDCRSEPWAQAAYTKVLIDPPRGGALELLPLIANLHAEKIVYVSCNPATLARDAGELVHKYGYTLAKAGVMDMFPHTAHVESIALFNK